jgi:integrase
VPLRRVTSLVAIWSHNMTQVNVGLSRGLLRLRWTYAKQRYSISLGVPDSPRNRAVAEAKAKEIELDIMTGNFDLSLVKYDERKRAELERHQNKQDENGISVSEHYITAPALFRRYYEYRLAFIRDKSRWLYEACLRYLDDVYNGRDATSLTQADASKLIRHIKGMDGLSARTKRERLVCIRSAWDWAILEGLTRRNPFRDAPKAIRGIGSKHNPKPFTHDEVKRIIEAFRNDRYYKHYADFIEFLFGTGCRTSEAIGLRWKDVSKDCKVVTIGTQLVRGERVEHTKTGRARRFRVSKSVAAILKAKQGSRLLHSGRDDDDAPASATHCQDDLVFVSPKGNPVNEKGLRRRGWTTILKRLGIKHRGLYQTRHTFVTHALEAGMPPNRIANITGHDVETMYRHYVGQVNDEPEAPDLWDDEDDDDTDDEVIED